MPDQPHRCAVRGVDLAVWQTGHGERDLVLVHGFQNDHAAWQPLVERLDLGRYRVTSFDLAGCGASAVVETWQRCTIEEYAADLLTLCDQAGIERPVVIGHSLGAATALSAALADPNRFDGLVLVAPASTSGLDFLPDEAAFDALAHPTRDQQRQLGRAAFHRPPPPEYLDALLATLERATPEHIEGAARSMRAFACQSDLGRLDVPTMLVCGDRDHHVPLRHHLATHQALRRARLQVYVDVGHVPFAETPDPCAEDVGRFLTTLH